MANAAATPAASYSRLDTDEEEDARHRWEQEMRLRKRYEAAEARSYSEVGTRFMETVKPSMGTITPMLFTVEFLHKVTGFVVDAKDDVANGVTPLFHAAFLPDHWTLGETCAALHFMAQFSDFPDGHQYDTYAAAFAVRIDALVACYRITGVWATSDPFELYLLAGKIAGAKFPLSSIQGAAIASDTEAEASLVRKYSSRPMDRKNRDRRGPPRVAGSTDAGSTMPQAPDTPEAPGGDDSRSEVYRTPEAKSPLIQAASSSPSSAAPSAGVNTLSAAAAPSPDIPARIAQLQVLLSQWKERAALAKTYDANEKMDEDMTWGEALAVASVQITYYEKLITSLKAERDEGEKKAQAAAAQTATDASTQKKEASASAVAPSSAPSGETVLGVDTQKKGEAQAAAAQTASTHKKEEAPASAAAPPSAPSEKTVLGVDMQNLRSSIAKYDFKHEKTDFLNFLARALGPLDYLGYSANGGIARWSSEPRLALVGDDGKLLGDNSAFTAYSYDSPKRKPASAPHVLLLALEGLLNAHQKRKSDIDKAYDKLVKGRVEPLLTGEIFGEQDRPTESFTRAALRVLLAAQMVLDDKDSKDALELPQTQDGGAISGSVGANSQLRTALLLMTNFDAVMENAKTLNSDGKAGGKVGVRAQNIYQFANQTGLAMRHATTQPVPSVGDPQYKAHAEMIRHLYSGAVISVAGWIAFAESCGLFGYTQKPTAGKSHTNTRWVFFAAVMRECFLRLDRAAHSYETATQSQSQAAMGRIPQQQQAAIDFGRWLDNTSNGGKGAGGANHSNSSSSNSSGGGKQRGNKKKNKKRIMYGPSTNAGALW